MLTLDDFMLSEENLWLKHHQGITLEKYQELIDQKEELKESLMELFGNGPTLTKGMPEMVFATKNHALNTSVIYNARFERENLSAESDILFSNGKKWNIAKFSTSREVNYGTIKSLAFTRYCAEPGFPIVECYAVHINGDYTSENGQTFLHQVNVTEAVKDYSTKLPEKIARRQEIIEGKKPSIKSSIKTKTSKLLQQIHRQDPVYDPARDGCRFIDEMVQAFIEKLSFPIHFIDFETMPLIKPFFPGTKPRQQVPYLVSMHKMYDWDENCDHHSLLVLNKEIHHYSETNSTDLGSEKTNCDPPDALFYALYPLLSEEGCLVTFNKIFENGQFKEFGQRNTLFRGWAEEQVNRNHDLMSLFEQGYVYDPRQGIRFSQKIILPIWTGLSYNDLEITNGKQESSSYYNLVRNLNVLSALEIQQRINNQHHYCTFDTGGMKALLLELKKRIC